MTIKEAKRLVRSVYPEANITAHGREIWLRSLSYESYKARDYDARKQAIISKMFFFDGPWSEVKDDQVWDETCWPVWIDAAMNLR